MADAPWYEKVHKLLESDPSLKWEDIKDIVLSMDSEDLHDKDNLVSSPWNYDPFVGMSRGEIKAKAFHFAQKYYEQCYGHDEDFPVNLWPFLKALNIDLFMGEMRKQDQLSIYDDRFGSTQTLEGQKSGRSPLDLLPTVVRERLPLQQRSMVAIRRKDTELLGFLYKEPGQNRAKMYIDKNSDPTRQLFTEAHEIGHSVQWSELESGSGVSEYETMTCVDYSVEPDGVDKERQEIFADAFGRALLIPEDAVISMLRDNSIVQIASRFGVSAQTIVHRMIDVDKGCLNDAKW